jgi:hypothetical protein
MRIFVTYTFCKVKIRMIKSRRMRWVGHVAQIGMKGNACRVLVGTPEGKRPQGKPRHRWLVNIRLDFGEIGWGGKDWIGLVLVGN